MCNNSLQFAFCKATFSFMKKRFLWKLCANVPFPRLRNDLYTLACMRPITPKCVTASHSLFNACHTLLTFPIFDHSQKLLLHYFWKHECVFEATVLRQQTLERRVTFELEVHYIYLQVKSCSSLAKLSEPAKATISTNLPKNGDALSIKSKSNDFRIQCNSLLLNSLMSCRKLPALKIPSFLVYFGHVSIRLLRNGFNFQSITP